MAARLRNAIASVTVDAVCASASASAGAARSLLVRSRFLAGAGIKARASSGPIRLLLVLEADGALAVHRSKIRHYAGAFGGCQPPIVEPAWFPPLMTTRRVDLGSILNMSSTSPPPYLSTAPFFGENRCHPQWRANLTPRGRAGRQVDDGSDS